MGASISIDHGRQRAAATAAIGVVVSWIPFALLGLAEISVIPTVGHVTLLAIIAVWAVTSVLGFVAMCLGVSRLGDLRTEWVGPSRRPGARMAIAAGIALVLGVVVLASTVGFIDSCQPPCIGGGGVMGPSSAAAASCGEVCAVNIGSGQLI